MCFIFEKCKLTVFNALFLFMNFSQSDRHRFIHVWKFNGTTMRNMHFYATRNNSKSYITSLTDSGCEINIYLFSRSRQI